MAADATDPLAVGYYAAVSTLAVACILLLLVDRDCKFACMPLSCEKGLLKTWDLRFLVPFGICVSADWLQGPYVYELYSEYGYDRVTINALFVAGFSCSMVVGPFVGALADRFGRKAMILTGYCTLYALACVTKHFQTLSVLYIGRFFGGAATSVLFTCFETWIVSEYTRREMSSNELRETLSRMYFVNGLSGMLMGLVANAGASASTFTAVGGGPFYVGGVIVPFDISFACLLLGMALVGPLWLENYGAKDASTGAAGLGNLGEALVWLAREPLVLLLLVGSACTEAAMYCFVIEWTPALTSAHTRPPHGIVFSCFMIAYMTGSTLASTLVSGGCKIHPSTLLCCLCLVAGCGMAVAWLILAAFPNKSEPVGATFALFICLVLFEGCLGGYFATVGTLKAKWVAEKMRATVYNFFRVPLNLLVVCNELLSPSTKDTFMICVALLIVAFSSFALARRMILKRETLEKNEGDSLIADKKGGCCRAC